MFLGDSDSKKMDFGPRMRQKCSLPYHDPRHFSGHVRTNRIGKDLKGVKLHFMALLPLGQCQNYPKLKLQIHERLCLSPFLWGVCLALNHCWCFCVVFSLQHQLFHSKSSLLLQHRSWHLQTKIQGFSFTKLQYQNIGMAILTWLNPNSFRHSMNLDNASERKNMVN